MRTKNLTPFLFGTKVTSLRPPQPHMTMIVRASFRLRPGEPLEPIEGLMEQGPLSGDIVRDDDDERTGEVLYASDLADFKLHADLLLAGSCHAPGGRPVVECPVRFSVGAWSKTLVVIGRRVWTEKVIGSPISDPEPFVTMPILWSNAFGGPGYAQNPAGRGRDTPDLPTVELAGERVRGKGDRPAPAGFGPLNPAWPQRSGKLGKEYGAKWRKERFPFWSEDFDWTYFNAAPADQQLPGYLVGDEEVSFVNLHPDAPVLSARLPALRVRAFVKDDQGLCREARMNLDTLLADLDRERIVLTWRGLVTVREDDLADVRTVVIASEPLADPPLSEQHYLAILEKFEADPVDADAHGLGKSGAALLVAAQDDAAHPERSSGERAKAILDRGDVFAVPAANETEVQRQLGGAKEKLGEARSAPKPAVAGAAAGAVSAEALLAATARVSDAIKKARAKGETPSDDLVRLERMLDDPERTKQLTALVPPRPEEIGPGKDLSGRNLARMDLTGKDLSGTNLEGANLQGAVLRGARLAGANLKRAILAQADLSDADLSLADLSQATLADARAPGARLRGATLDGTLLQGADLSGAVLAETKGEMTVLSGADLTDADLRGAALTKAFADGAILTRADLSGSKLVRCQILRAEAEGMTLSKAFLTGTSFAGGDLRRANLREIRGEATVWTGATLEEADLRYSVLPSAHFTEAKAASAKFFGADLRNADFYRACLDRADLERANLFEANLGKSTLNGARFVDANLFDARFLGAGGKDTDFVGANLKRAILPS
jgi:uncharacterized protein YjbI with pentapeptide repeats